MILSNTDEARFGFIKDTFPQIQFFNEFMLSYQLGYVKPQPQIFQAALAQTGSQPSECVFIDDLSENVSAAAELGIRTILFRDRSQLENELRELGLVF
jgi:putative hydrolase of the HAD superfamily